MDDPEDVPLVFAHQVIGMLASHLTGDSEVAPQGLRVIRVVFRRLGGSWFELCQGNPKHTNLLIETVKAWGSRNSKDQ